MLSRGTNNKNMKKLHLITLLLIGALFTACSDDTTDPDPTPTPVESNTIVDVAVDNDFTILVSALERVNLAETLEGDGPFTVFAPTDSAFSLLLTELNLNSLDEVSDADLTQILLNHVVSGEVKSTELSNGYVSTLADGPEETKISMLVDLSNGVTLNNRANVSAADVMADNGVVHVVDKVILIPNVVDAALANPSFTTLVAALTNENLTTDFVATLSGTGPFTVFAPTNDAFGDLLDSNMDWNGLGDIPTATLEAVLAYHVASGANVTSSELTDGQSVSTVQGSSFTINLGDDVTITDGQQGTSTVIATDVQTSNGVIHVINKVLLP